MLRFTYQTRFYSLEVVYCGIAFARKKENRGNHLAVTKQKLSAVVNAEVSKIRFFKIQT